MAIQEWLAVAAVYGGFAVLLTGGYWCFARWRSARNFERYEQARRDGLNEPVSLHPVIDPAVCIGCGACVDACPEQTVLGLIGRRAQLIAAANCVGHGACAQACPAEAIELVFGTANRGVDIPHVDRDFQTNVSGIYIAGELGGMGLIRNAIEQGRQAAEAVAAAAGKPAAGDVLDLVIVGAGPAGISAALAARQRNLAFVVLEQDTVGGAIAHYPRGKVVMTAPAKLPMLGEFRFRETSKESLVQFWMKTVADAALPVRTGERVDRIERAGGAFTVVTAAGCYRARNVLLAIGRRGTPRKLGVSGEELPKVVYRLVDPEQYRGLSTLVVGGGDSAIEAALAIAGEPGAKVALSYRRGSFARAKQANRERLERITAEGRVSLKLNTEVERIESGAVVLRNGSGSERIDNDAIIVCAGGIVPTEFLKRVGVAVATHYGKH